MIFIFKHWKFSGLIALFVVGVFIVPKLWAKYGFEVYSKKTIRVINAKAFNDSVSVLSLNQQNMILVNEAEVRDSLLYSLQNDVSILKANESLHQNNEMALSRALKSCQNQFVEAVANGGIVRDSIFLESDKKLFKERTWKVVQRPDNLIIK